MAKHELGGKFIGVRFSEREAECMRHILRGKTVRKIAEDLKLSPRTVECYVRNMKRKLGCRTKSALIEAALASRFFKKLPSL